MTAHDPSAPGTCVSGAVKTSKCTARQAALLLWCFRPVLHQKFCKGRVVPGLRPPAELSPGAVWQGCPRTALQEQPLSLSARQCAGRRYYLQLFVSTLGSGSWQSQPSC